MKKIIQVLLVALIFIACNENEINDAIVKIPKSKANLLIKNIFPKSQNFILSVSKDTLFLGNRGTIIVIPSNAFLNEDNKLVTGKVNVELIEVLTIDDFISADLHTVGETGLLESGGMIYINATQNGQQLKLLEGKKLYIEIPTVDKKERMQVFEGKYDFNDKIVWLNPKKLDKYIVTVPISSLNFSSDTVIRAIGSVPDSLTEKQALELEIIVRDTVINPCIGTDLIKFLKNQRFEQTLIATREFEERMKFIKKACDEKVLRLYLENLNEDLWEIDSMVYDYLKFNKPDIANDFLEFSNQKLTRVKNSKTIETGLIQRFFDKIKIRRKKELEERKIRNQDELESQKKRWQKIKKEQEDFEQKVLEEQKELIQKIEEQKKQFITYYPLNLTTLGWANIDRFYDDPRTKEIELEVKVSKADEYTDISVNLIMKYKNMYVPSFRKTNGNYSFTHGEYEKYSTLPIGEIAIIFVTGKIENDLYYSNYNFKIGDKNIEEIIMKKTTLDALKNEIQKIGD